MGRRNRKTRVLCGTSSNSVFAWADQSKPLRHLEWMQLKASPVPIFQAYLGICRGMKCIGSSTIFRTLPLSGRQGAISIEEDSKAACPLQGLVRRCRFFTGSHCGPLHRQENSSHLRLTSHTGAQFRAKGRDELQDGVKARAALTR
jgi:hypothetical protein